MLAFNIAKSCKRSTTMRRRRRKALPTETFYTTIENLGHDGRGIAHKNGKTLFVDGALPGEEVGYVYTNMRSQLDEGRAVEVINASPDRVSPPCTHTDICGGCSLQHISNKRQCEHKQDTLVEQLQHIGQTVPEEVLAPLTGPSTHYRRKARLAVRYVHKKERVLVGFREKAGRFVADIQSCAVLDKRIGNKLTQLSELILSLSNYDQIAQIEVAIDDDTVALIFRHLSAFTDNDLQSLTAFGKTHNLHIYLQPKGIESVTLFYPTDANELLHYRIHSADITMYFHPCDFTQVNADINEKMISQALTLLSPKTGDKILDLFCGIGNFTLPIAKHCRQVVGVEGSVTAIERACMNARENNIANTEFHVADLFENHESAPWQTHFDKLIIDPPRSGADTICQHIEVFNAKRIVYISCNPATLARDTKTLIDKGYSLRKAGIMDMFPHTRHVESIALFER